MSKEAALVISRVSAQLFQTFKLHRRQQMMANCVSIGGKQLIKIWDFSHMVASCLEIALKRLEGKSPENSFNCPSLWFINYFDQFYSSFDINDRLCGIVFLCGIFCIWHISNYIESLHRLLLVISCKIAKFERKTVIIHWIFFYSIQIAWKHFISSVFMVK